jgi:hypothetical protein
VLSQHTRFAQQISVPLDEEQAAFVQQRADAEERSKAQIIRRLVAEAARRQRDGGGERAA